MSKLRFLSILVVLTALSVSVSGCRSFQSGVLQIYSDKQDRVIGEYEISAGDSFRLEYIHSSEKTPIHDYFLIDAEGRIILTEERFDWYAVGLECHPFYDKSNIVFDDGVTRVFLNREFDVFPIRVGWIAQQVVVIAGENIKLKNIAEPGDLLKLSVVRK